MRLQRSQSDACNGQLATFGCLDDGYATVRGRIDYIDGIPLYLHAREACATAVFTSGVTTPLKIASDLLDRVSVNQLARGVQVAISPFAHGTERTLAVPDVLRAYFGVVADAAPCGDQQN